MYVHIGEDTLVRSEAIITIISKESAASSPEIEAFLSKNAGKIQDISKGNYKSLVITNQAIYLSSLSSGTLRKRTSLRGVIENLI